MANDITKNPLIVDTAASTVVMAGRITVDSVRWVGGATAGHTAVIQDANDRVLLSMIAGTTNWDEESVVRIKWRDGFKVPTLGSGILYIYLHERE